MEETQIVVNVEASPLLEPMQRKLELRKINMQTKLDTLWGNTHEAKNFTIFRIPQNISQSKKNLFEPSVISIGPFHRGKQTLRTMEDQKWQFLQDFLSRQDHIRLDLCISEMSLLEERTRRCYSETFDYLDSDAFVEMMLLDGCFVLEYFLKAIVGNLNSIFEVGWNSHFINRDLVLQENQIPFFIVEKLYQLIVFNQEFRMIFPKYIAYFLLPDNSIFPDPPAETTDTIESIITDPPAEIPDHLAEIPNPSAEIPDPRNEILDPPAEIPGPPAEIPGPPAEIPDLPAEFVDLVAAAIRDILDLLAEIRDPPAEIIEFLAEIPDPPAEIHHLLHLCYHYLVPNPEKPLVLSSKSFNLTKTLSANRIIKGLLHRFRSRLVRRRRSRHSTSQSLSVAFPNSTGNISSMVMRSATELKQKGLKFTQQSNPRHMLDISFEYGVLKIPRLTIIDSTKPLFANLLAFEHSKYGKENSPFGRFLSFLDKLVNTPNDVTILQECGILENWLGSQEELADFFNQVSEGNFVASNHYLAELYTEVNRYTESSWPRHRAKLIRDYFSSPWATISVVAAFILLVLTLVQSFFAVFAYFIPPSS
ncbi:UPF0481 protein At3g47200-like [Carex rostrata]